MISASWDVLAAGRTVSGIELLFSPRMAAFSATYTTPADTLARETCKGVANMLVVGLPTISMVNSPPEAR
jgi:hypothetical protein